MSRLPPFFKGTGSPKKGGGFFQRLAPEMNDNLRGRTLVHLLVIGLNLGQKLTHLEVGRASLVDFCHAVVSLVFFII